MKKLTLFLGAMALTSGGAVLAHDHTAPKARISASQKCEMMKDGMKMPGMMMKGADGKMSCQMMDHSKMDHSKMDHSKMSAPDASDKAQPAMDPKMDHSKMDHSMMEPKKDAPE